MKKTIPQRLVLAACLALASLAGPAVAAETESSIARVRGCTTSGSSRTRRPGPAAITRRTSRTASTARRTPGAARSATAGTTAARMVPMPRAATSPVSSRHPGRGGQGAGAPSPRCCATRRTATPTPMLSAKDAGGPRALRQQGPGQTWPEVTSTRRNKVQAATARKRRRSTSTPCARAATATDGKKVKDGPPLGSVADNGAEMLHKLLNGQPGEAMPALRALDHQIAADIAVLPHHACRRSGCAHRGPRLGVAAPAGRPRSASCSGAVSTPRWRPPTRMTFCISCHEMKSTVYVGVPARAHTPPTASGVGARVCRLPRAEAPGGRSCLRKIQASNELFHHVPRHHRHAREVRGQAQAELAEHVWAGDEGQRLARMPQLPQLGGDGLPQADAARAREDGRGPQGRQDLHRLPQGIAHSLPKRDD